MSKPSRPVGSLSVLLAQRARSRAAECARDAADAIEAGQYDQAEELLAAAVAELARAEDKERGEQS